MASLPPDPTFLAAARAASEARSFNQNHHSESRSPAGNPSHPTRIPYPSHSFPLHLPIRPNCPSHPVCRRRTISGHFGPTERPWIGSGAGPELQVRPGAIGPGCHHRWPACKQWGDPVRQFPASQGCSIVCFFHDIYAGRIRGAWGRADDEVMVA